MDNTCCSQNCYTITGLYAKTGDTLTTDNQKRNVATYGNHDRDPNSKYCKRELADPDYILVSLDDDFKTERTNNHVKSTADHNDPQANITDLSIKNMQEELIRPSKRPKLVSMRSKRDDNFFIENGFIPNALTGVEKFALPSSGTARSECQTPLMFKGQKEAPSPVYSPRKHDSQFIARNEFEEIFS